MMATGSGKEKAAGRQFRSGLTLIELIVVMVIISILMGLGIAVFKNANRDLGVRVAVRHLVARVRAIRDHARIQRTPAWAVLDLGDPMTVWTLRRETWGNWHFESLDGSTVPGALGRDGKGSGNLTLVPGKVGQAIELGGGGGIDCGEIPRLAQRQGVAIECWIYRRPVGEDQMLFSMGDQIKMRLAGGETPEAKVGSRVIRPDTTTVIPVDTWVKVLFVFNGKEAEIFINGKSVARDHCQFDWPASLSCKIGGRGGVSGLLDELRLDVIIAQEPYVLPKEVVFSFPDGTIPDGMKEYWIHFDSNGALDAARHGGPVVCSLKSPAEEYAFDIPMTGILTIREVEPPPPSPEARKNGKGRGKGTPAPLDQGLGPSGR